MAFKKSASAAASSKQARPPITLERVIKIAPNGPQAEKIAAAFGLAPVDYDGIRDASKRSLIDATQDLTDGVGRNADGDQVMNEVALKMHMQRITASFVTSAFMAAEFYGARVTAARDMMSKLANDNRDEDREGVYGFEAKAARARAFAAQAGLQAFGLLAAAEGAALAFEHITGETWKPFTPDVAPGLVSREAAGAEMNAFA